MPSIRLALAIALLLCVVSHQVAAAQLRTLRRRLAAVVAAFSELEDTPAPAAAPWQVLSAEDDEADAKLYTRAVMPAHTTVATEDVQTRANGACAREAGLLCPGAHSGYGRVAACLQRRIEREDRHARVVRQVSPACRREVRLIIDRQVTPSGGTASALRAARLADAARLCELPSAGASAALLLPRRVVACLRESKAKLDWQCREAVFADQLAAAWDYTHDWPLHDACVGDVARFCGDVPRSPGSVMACLHDRRSMVRLEPVLQAVASDSHFCIGTHM
jgi:Cysteine rich repeat